MVVTSVGKVKTASLNHKVSEVWKLLHTLLPKKKGNALKRVTHEGKEIHNNKDIYIYIYIYICFFFCLSAQRSVMAMIISLYPIMIFFFEVGKKMCRSPGGRGGWRKFVWLAQQ